MYLVYVTAPKYRRLMVIWLVLCFLGLQLTSTIVISEEVFSASDTPCHTAKVDVDHPCPCCDHAEDCEPVATCVHAQLSAAIIEDERSLAGVLNYGGHGLAAARFSGVCSPPILRPPITPRLQSNSAPAAMTCARRHELNI
jgi:hypothetical protein